LGDYPDHEGESVFTTWLSVGEQQVPVQFVYYRQGYDRYRAYIDKVWQDFRHRTADGVFLMYSITDLQSFEKIASLY
jgi:hypothetical protein